MHLSPSDRRIHESYEFAREAAEEGPEAEESCGACGESLAEDDGIWIDGSWCCAVCVLQEGARLVVEDWPTRSPAERGRILQAIRHATEVLA